MTLAPDCQSFCCVGIWSPCTLGDALTLLAPRLVYLPTLFFFFFFVESGSEVCRGWSGRPLPYAKYQLSTESVRDRLPHLHQKGAILSTASSCLRGHRPARVAA